MKREEDATKVERVAAVKERDDQAALVKARDIELDFRKKEIERLKKLMKEERQRMKKVDNAMVEKFTSTIVEAKTKALEEFYSSEQFQQELSMANTDAYILGAWKLANHLRRHDPSLSFFSLSLHKFLTSKEERKAKEEVDARLVRRIQQGSAEFVARCDQAIEEGLLPSYEPAAPEGDTPTGEVP